MEWNTDARRALKAIHLWVEPRLPSLTKSGSSILLKNNKPLSRKPAFERGAHG